MTRIKNWALSLAIYFFLLGLVELAGRYYIKVQEKQKISSNLTENLMSIHEPLVGFGLKKNIKLDMGTWALETNGLGLREKTPLPIEKPEGEIRIFVIGGSTVFGWGVNDSKTIPAELQSLFDSRATPGKKIRVINAGIPWYNSSQELAFTLYRLLPLSPDAIWAFDGLNDAAQAIAPDWTPDYLGYLDFASSLLFGKREANRWWENVLQFSHTLTYFRAKMKAREETKTGVFHPEASEQYLRYHELLASVLEKKKIPYQTFLQPVLALDKPASSFEIGHNGTSMRDKAFRETFIQQYQHLEVSLQRASQFSNHSLRKIFSGYIDDIYLDGLHYNADGNRIIAKKIFELVANDMPYLFL